jgi:hypothetical protein
MGPAGRPRPPAPPDRPIGRPLAVADPGRRRLPGRDRFVFAHDDPAPGLSVRGLLTIALAAAVVVLLSVRRTAGPGPLTRALFEYGVVFLLAVLVATTGVDVDQAPASGKRAAVDQRSALVKSIDGFGDWLSQWRDWAHTETDRRGESSSTTPAPALSPSSTRRPL